jgi:hypothetical protein
MCLKFSVLPLSLFLTLCLVLVFHFLLVCVPLCSWFPLSSPAVLGLIGLTKLGSSWLCLPVAAFGLVTKISVHELVYEIAQIPHHFCYCFYVLEGWVGFPSFLLANIFLV